jgi:uncharacterized hydrophobic protein (TIGR00271 family)
MLDLKVFGASGAMEEVAARLDAISGTGQVRVVDAARPGSSVVRADVAHDCVDDVLDELERLDVPAADVSMARIELVGQLAGRRSEASLVWADVVGVAGSNARLVGRYLAFMAVAGVVGCYGVVDRSAVLIVGAMAVSPDLLPITAIAVGVIGRDVKLARRALLTLVAGLAVSGIFAALLTLLQNELDLLPAGFSIHDTFLQGMTDVSDETIVVALFAGVAGMLAIETRASAGVGVAISVTTIPAVAFFGVALGLGEAREATGALAVLSLNVLFLVIGAAGTLLLQRRRRRLRHVLRQDRTASSDPRDARTGARPQGR